MAEAAGAAGSIVSQGLGIAIGQQSSFNWGQVGLAAIGGAVGGGISESGAFDNVFKSGFLDDVAQGVGTNVLTQGIDVATGLQHGFSWAGIAQAGVSAGLASALPNGAPTSLRGIGNSLISGLSGGFAGAATTSLLSHTDFGSNLLNSIPNAIGQTIGNEVAYQISQRSNSASQANNAPKAGATYEQNLAAHGFTFGDGGLTATPTDNTMYAPDVTYEPGVNYSGVDGPPSDTGVDSAAPKLGNGLNSSPSTSSPNMLDQAVSLLNSSKFMNNFLDGEELAVINESYGSGKIKVLSDSDFSTALSSQGSGDANGMDGFTANETTYVKASSVNNYVDLAILLAHEGFHLTMDYENAQYSSSPLQPGVPPIRQDSIGEEALANSAAARFANGLSQNQVSLVQGDALYTDAIRDYNILSNKGASGLFQSTYNEYKNTSAVIDSNGNIIKSLAPQPNANFYKAWNWRTYLNH